MDQDIFIKDLSNELQELIKANYKKQHLIFNPSVKINASVSRGEFFWFDSNEGINFWRDVFEKYASMPKLVKQPIINTFKFC